MPAKCTRSDDRQEADAADGLKAGRRAVTPATTAAIAPDDEVRDDVEGAGATEVTDVTE